jgi:hypothetical protein
MKKLQAAPYFAMNNADICCYLIELFCFVNIWVNGSDGCLQKYYQMQLKRITSAEFDINIFFFLGASCPSWNRFASPSLETTDVKNFQWSRNLSPLDFLNQVLLILMVRFIMLRSLFTCACYVPSHRNWDN